MSTTTTSTTKETEDKGKDASTAAPAPGEVADVTVHPLVLLSAADHYHRVARGTRKRVVGVLLGTVTRGRVDATNSFAVPFEEDSKNPAVFYLDHNYLENMLLMFRKVSSKERVVGFYSTGPQIRANDLRIHSLLKRFQPAGTVTPLVFVIIDVRPDRQSIPTTAYRVVEEVDTTPSGGGDGEASAEVRKSFAHVPSLIGAMEAEEIGVEHLMRDINDPTISTVTSLVKAKMSGLSSLVEKLTEIASFLKRLAEKLPSPDAMDDQDQTRPSNLLTRGANREIISNCQTILNLLPNLNVEELVKALMIKTNDMHMVVYISSLIRTIIALHDLITNKIKYGMEREMDGVLEETPSKKEAESTDEEKKEDDTKTESKTSDEKMKE